MLGRCKSTCYSQNSEVSKTFPRKFGMLYFCEYGQLKYLGKLIKAELKQNFELLRKKTVSNENGS